MRIGPDDLLVAEPGDPLVRSVPTCRMSRMTTGHPIGVVWHWTGGKGGPGFAGALAQSISGYRRGIDRPASWHVLIARDGTLWQSAPFTAGTWHVGRPGTVGGIHLANVNQGTVGVELENAGRLRNIEGAWRCWPYAVGHEVHADRALVAAAWPPVSGGVFDGYSKEQEQSATLLAIALADRYGMKRDAFLHGHCSFDYPRKEDPGPLWMGAALPRVLDAVF